MSEKDISIELPSKIINRIEGLASRTEEVYDENSSWGPFYQSSKEIAETIAVELWSDIKELRRSRSELASKWRKDNRERHLENCKRWQRENRK